MERNETAGLGVVQEVPPLWVEEAPTASREGPTPAVPGGGPMERIAIDLTGPLPRTKSGNTSIMVVANYFTNWVEAFPFRTRQQTLWPRPS